LVMYLLRTFVKSKHKAYFCALAQLLGLSRGCWRLLAPLILGVAVYQYILYFGGLD
jgi:ribosomal protein S14